MASNTASAGQTNRPASIEILFNGYPQDIPASKLASASTELSLFDSDLVVVNTADQAPTDGEVFAINYEGELVIKRLRRGGGKWSVCSDYADQRRHTPKRCMDAFLIIGHVFNKQSERIGWSGHLRKNLPPPFLQKA